MNIACLGWGSVVWDPRELAVKGDWFNDGPFLPIEFARQSRDNRITLVIASDQGLPLVRTLWIPLALDSILDAVEALRLREGVLKKNKDIHIHSVQSGPYDGSDDIFLTIAKWATQQSLDAVVWTALPPKINDEERFPTSDEVVAHLSDLRGPELSNAKRYVKMTPRQIDTPNRREIEAKLGWDVWPDQ